MILKQIIKKGSALLLAFAVAVPALLTGCSVQPADEVETHTVEGTLKIGIVSDMQLAPKGGSDVYDNAYRKTLEFFKSQNVNMMINAGDYTDTATQKAVDNYAAILNEVYPAEQRPVSLSILGNHDYWLPYFVDCWEIPFKSKMQRRFLKATGETSPWTHKVVNGYHFIGFSPTNGNMDSSAYTDKIDWAREQIELAIQDDPDKPVFVITHAPPSDTVYMSDEEDYSALSELFAQYPQVVSISGHTHAPLLEDRSIWQGKYTAVNTQCVSYVCFEKGMLCSGTDDASIEQNPMCMILEITDDALTFTRYSILTGEQQGEPWRIPQPIAQNLNLYSADRASRWGAPVFAQDAQFSAEFLPYGDGGQELAVSFNSAQHDNYVYSYTLTAADASGQPVRFQNGEDADGNPVYLDALSWVSDFYLGLDAMQPRTTLRLGDYTASLPDGTYTLSVTAADTWGHESAPVTAQLSVSGGNVSVLA